jgi:hypothetical protein
MTDRFSRHCRQCADSYALMDFSTVGAIRASPACWGAKPSQLMSSTSEWDRSAPSGPAASAFHEVAPCTIAR